MNHTQINKMIKIKCIETGQIFNSIRIATKEMKINRNKIMIKLNGLNTNLNYNFIKI
jgi:hypothetical protein